MQVSQSDKTTQRAALLIATMSSFLTPFTSSSVNIALPSIGSDLSLSAISLSWVAVAYLLASAMLLVPFGRVADIFGRKRVFQIGIVIDAVASILCAFSNSEELLITFRALQGIGGAMIFGTGVAILTSVYPPEKRGAVLGINTAAVYTGLSAGPLLGGLLTGSFGWQSIFLLNAFLGIVISITVFWKLKGEWAGSRGEKIDFTGSAIYSVSLLMIMLAFSLLPAPVGGVLIAAGVAGIIIFVLWELRQKYPVLNISLFKNNTVFAFSNLAALLNYSATFAVAFLLSLYLQYIKGFSPEHAGLVLIVQPVVQVICSPIAGRLSDKIEPRIVASAGMFLTTAGLIMLVFLGDNSSLFYVLLSLVILGLGFGFFSSPNINAVMSSIDRKHYGIASGTVGTMRLIGQNFSMGMILLLFALFIGSSQITQDYYPLFLHSMKIAFIISAVLCFSGIFISAARGKTRE